MLSRACSCKCYHWFLRKYRSAEISRCPEHNVHPISIRWVDGYYSPRFASDKWLIVISVSRCFTMRWTFTIFSLTLHNYSFAREAQCNINCVSAYNRECNFVCLEIQKLYILRSTQYRNIPYRIQIYFLKTPKI